MRSHERCSDHAGKTTFIKNLLAPYAQDPDVKVNNVSGPEALKVFIETPEKLSTTVLVNDHNSLTSFHYRVQDTPGMSSFLNGLLRGDSYQMVMRAS